MRLLHKPCGIRPSDYRFRLLHADALGQPLCGGKRVKSHYWHSCEGRPDCMSCLTRLRQLKVLRLVQRCPGITQAEVVEILRLHKSAALRVLQSLSGQHEIFGIKSRRAHSKAVFLRYYPLDVSRIQELEEFLKGVAE